MAAVNLRPEEEPGMWIPGTPLIQFS